MSKRSLSLFLLLAVCCLCLADDGPTCRLTRTKRPANREEGLLRPELSVSTKEELVWTTVLRGHHLTFRVSQPGESFFAGVEIGVDGQDPVSSMGSMALGENKEVFNFAPVALSLDTVRLPLFLRMERYRHINEEVSNDITRLPGGTGFPGFAEPYGTKIEYVPYVSGWDLLLGNAEAFTGRFEFKRGRWCTLWLFDADLNGTFGDPATESGGDLLLWEYGEGEGFLGIGGARRGVCAFGTEARIAGRKYAVKAAADGPDTIVLEMTDGEG